MDYSWEFGYGRPQLKINSWRCNSGDYIYASSYKTAHISGLDIWFSDVSSYSSSLTVYYVGTDDKFQFINKSTTLTKAGGDYDQQISNMLFPSIVYFKFSGIHLGGGAWSGDTVRETLYETTSMAVIYLSDGGRYQMSDN